MAVPTMAVEHVTSRLLGIIGQWYVTLVTNGIIAVAKIYNQEHKVTRGNFDRWGTFTHFSFQHFPLNVADFSNYFDW